MADDEITNRMLLEHMQAMKQELLQNIGVLEQRMNGMEQRMNGMEQQMERGFIEAREHRQALQEDLDATIRQQSEHQKKLEHLA